MNETGKVLGRTVAEVLGDEPATLLRSDPKRTGFKALDANLGGGLHDGGLVLIGGAPGVGKTTLALQMATSIAKDGGPVTYLCFEHSEEDLLVRLLLLEAGLGHPFEAPLERGTAAAGPDGAEDDPRLSTAILALRSYGHRVRLIGGSAAHEFAGSLESLCAAGQAALFVDYLQKMPGSASSLAEHGTTSNVQRLKDHALRCAVPVVALAAADREGLDRPRLRLNDLRGSSALAYEADVALMLNEKQRVVARQHLVYGNPDAGRFHDFVICTIEKNRSGRASIDLELRKRFSHGCFDPTAGPVAERLIDERVYRD